MTWPHVDIPPSIVGVVTGFALAQITGISKVAWTYWRRPRLQFEYRSDDLVTLSDSYLSGHESIGRKVYGLTIKNSGKTAARNVQVFLEKFDLSDDGKSYHPYICYMQALPWLDAEKTQEYATTSILPRTSVAVSVGAWHENMDGIWFETRRYNEYYEEAMAGVRYIKVYLTVIADNAKQRRLTHVMKVP